MQQIRWKFFQWHNYQVDTIKPLCQSSSSGTQKVLKNIWNVFLISWKKIITSFVDLFLLNLFVLWLDKLFLFFHLICQLFLICLFMFKTCVSINVNAQSKFSVLYIGALRNILCRYLSLDAGDTYILLPSILLYLIKCTQEYLPKKVYLNIKNRPHNSWPIRNCGLKPSSPAATSSGNWWYKNK